MSSHKVSQEHPFSEGNLLSADRFPLEHSFLNPTWADGTRGGLEVARRRIGVLTAALAAGEETHPVMSAENLRDTVRQELLELEAILEAVEQEMDRDEKRAEHPSEPVQP